jgi:hypothetical protein
MFTKIFAPNQDFGRNREKAEKIHRILRESTSEDRFPIAFIGGMPRPRLEAPAGCRAKWSKPLSQLTPEVRP